MEQKKDLSWWLSLALKVLAGFALYFSVAILITVCDSVMAVGNIGLGYVFLILGLPFLFVQFYFAFKTSGEIFAAKGVHWSAKAAKVIASLTLYVSLAVLAVYGEDIINPATASIGIAVVFAGVMLFVTQSAMIAYGIGHIVEGKPQSESKTK